MTSEFEMHLERRIIEWPKHEKTIGNMQIIYRDGSRPCSAYGKMIPIIPRPSFAQTLEIGDRAFLTILHSLQGFRELDHSKK